MTEDSYKAVSSYPIKVYKCGLRAGDRLRLKKNLQISDLQGRSTDQVHTSGEIWIVLPGSAEEPVDVWLQQPDGNSHTWDDDSGIFDWFEKID